MIGFDGELSDIENLMCEFGIETTIENLFQFQILEFN